MLYRAVRPLLFRLETETAHHLTLRGLDVIGRVMPNVTFDNPPIKVMGIDFPNRVGLAAGLDKNGAHIIALGKLGFGFLEVGTVTPLPQSGNPKPRLFRLPEKQAIINRMGFNNDGVAHLVENVKQSRNQYPGVLGINIGKNRETPNRDAASDYLKALKAAYPYADYITANISSPNTLGLRELQESEAIKTLLDCLKVAQVKLAKEYGYKPIAIKIAPDLSDEAISELAILFKQFEIDGVIATNTTINRHAVANTKYANEGGGLSGRPVREQSTHVIRVLADALSGALPIVGVGGINSADDAIEKLSAGASLIQLYSGLIYQGPDLVKQIVKSIS